MLISSNFKKLSLERKEEVKDMALAMNNAVNNYYYDHKKYKYDAYLKLSKAYYFLQRYYKTTLTDEEKSVFYLYILFPNDDYFMELVERHEKDFKKIGNIYQVSDGVVKLRYILQKSMMIERQLEEVVSKKKAMSN